MVAGRSLAARSLAPALATHGRTPAQAALRFVLAFPELSTAIPGCKTPAHVEENLVASEAPVLTKEEVAKARDLHARDFGL